MSVSLVYKETRSSCGKFVDKVDLIELDESEEEAQRYIRLYSLQLPKEEKSNSTFRVLTLSVD